MFSLAGKTAARSVSYLQLYDKSNSRYLIETVVKCRMCSTSVEDEQLNSKKGGFAKAYEKFASQETEEPKDTSFLSLLRNSKFIDLIAAIIGSFICFPFITKLYLKTCTYKRQKHRMAKITIFLIVCSLVIVICFVSLATCCQKDGMPCLKRTNCCPKKFPQVALCNGTCITTTY